MFRICVFYSNVSQYANLIKSDTQLEKLTLHLIYLVLIQPGCLIISNNV